MSSDFQLFLAIQESSCYCNNCFNQMYEKHVINYIVFENGDVRPVRKSTKEILSDDREPINVIGSWNDPMTRGTTTACAECGVVRWTTVQRPLSKSEFFRYGANLANSIEKLEFVDFDRRLFFEVLESEKRDPESQFEDDKLYRRAVDQAASLV